MNNTKFHTKDGNHPTIKVHNIAQAALYHVIDGQISNGIWENSSPKDHYQIMCEAKTAVAAEGEAVGLNFYKMRNYNLMACWEYCEADIIATVKTVSVVPEALGREYYTIPNVGNQITKWSPEGTTVIHTFTAEEVAAMEAFEYTSSQAKKDLKAVNDIVAGRDTTVHTDITKIAKVKIEKAVVKGAKTTPVVTETTAYDTTVKANMNRINKAAESLGLEYRVTGANGKIFRTNVDGTVTFHQIEYSKWSDITLEQWITLLSN